MRGRLADGALRQRLPQPSRDEADDQRVGDRPALLIEAELRNRLAYLCCRQRSEKYEVRSQKQGSCFVLPTPCFERRHQNVRRKRKSSAYVRSSLRERIHEKRSP